MTNVRLLPAEELRANNAASILDDLSKVLAVRVQAWLDPERCQQWVQGVYEAREHWVSDFRGQQFTLGRAWYTHLEQGRTKEYFSQADQADRILEQYAPGLQQFLIDTAQLALRAPVVRRPRWCGPGIHIFPAECDVSRNGGTVHFDLEGLTPAQQQQLSPTLTLVLMLQPPESGGGLKVWEVRHDEGEECEPGPEVASEIVPYETGDLVLLDSYRLHQIQPFGGSRDRISATAHLVVAGGQWEIWF